LRAGERGRRRSGREARAGRRRGRPAGGSAPPATAAAIVTALAIPATAALVALAVILARPHGSAAQEIREVDEGRFHLHAGGQRVGSEAFAIRWEGSTLKAVARVTLDGSGGPFRPGEYILNADSTLRPLYFGAQPSSGARRAVVALREGERLRLQTSTEAGDRMKEFLAPAELAVLEPSLAHHYHVLLARHASALDATGSWSGPALVPTASERRRIRVEARGTETVTLGDRRVEARAFGVTLDGTEIRVLRAADGRVIRVEAADGSWRAVRVEEGGEDG